MERQLYTVVVVKLDKDGHFEQIIVEPETLLARNEQDAVVKITAKYSHVMDEEVRVLCHFF